MNPRLVFRFAQTSLALYAHEGAFAIDVHAEDELEETVAAFEALGCAVEREPLRLRLRVTPATVAA